MTTSLSAIPAPPRPTARGAVASARHTVLLVSLFLALAGAGALFQGRASSVPTAPAGHPNVVPLYLSLLGLEWGLLLYVWRGLRASRAPLRELIGVRWAGPRDVARDAAIGVGLWLAWELLETGWGRVLGHGHAASIERFLPIGILESALWVVVSISAGFVEELVFRGYLMRQFAAWTRSPGAALVLQAAVFGVGHGYQGGEASLRIVAGGLLFGAVALWRRSLGVGMIAHALTDIVGGIFRV